MKELLLDTCAFLWLALTPDKIPPKAAALLNDPGNPRLLSQASVLEIVLKHRIGKLPLPQPPDVWIPARRDFFHIRQIEMTDEVIFRSGRLTHDHGDPFDRLIAALAMERACTLLSSDLRLRDLGADVLWD